jgi:hypothetical protein
MSLRGEMFAAVEDVLFEDARTFLYLTFPAVLTVIRREQTHKPRME